CSRADPVFRTEDDRIGSPHERSQRGASNLPARQSPVDYGGGKHGYHWEYKGTPKPARQGCIAIRFAWPDAHGECPPSSADEIQYRFAQKSDQHRKRPPERYVDRFGQPA